MTTRGGECAVHEFRRHRSVAWSYNAGVARFAALFSLLVAVIILIVGARHVRNEWITRPHRRPVTLTLALVFLIFLGAAMTRVVWESAAAPASVRATLDLLFVEAGFLLGYALTWRGGRG